MSTPLEWHVPPELNQPLPRKVSNPYWGCGPAAVAGFILFIPVILILVCALSIYTQDGALKESGITVQAKVVDLNITGRGSKTSRNVYYEYMCSPFPGVKGFVRKSMNTVGAAEYSQLKIGQSIPIVCALSNPNMATIADINTVRARDSEGEATSVIINVLVPIIVIFVIGYLYLYLGYRREQKILEFGRVVPAKIINAQLCPWRGGRGCRYMITKYEFMDHNGKCITKAEDILVSNGVSPETFAVTYNTVVYHPDNSAQCMLYPPTYAAVDSGVY